MMPRSPGCAEAKPGSAIWSQPRDIARDRLAVALRQRLQDLRHVLVAGALVVDVVAHGGDEILVAQPGEPRGGRTALEILLVAGLALRDRLRRLAGRRRPLLRRPRLGGEIDRHRAQLLDLQALGDG